MKKTSVKALCAGAIVCAALISCGQGPVEYAQKYVPNGAPVIVSFTSDYIGDGSDITAGTHINIAVEAYDPDGKGLTYSFSGGGSFQDLTVTPQGCAVTFVVGNITGGTAIVVNVKISDEKGVSANQALNLAQASLGPVISRMDAQPDEVHPQMATYFTFQADKDGYYQVRKNPPEPLTADNAFDPGLPMWSYSKNNPVSVNIYPSLYTGPKTDPPPPYIVLDGALPDNIFVIVFDKINQFSYHKITYSLDATPPVPGNTGAIGISDIQYTTMKLDWQKANDAVEPQANLKYKIVYSAVNNIGSVADAEVNGTVFLDWNADINTTTVTGLTYNSDYFFNVLSKDTLNNTSAYAVATNKTQNDLVPPVPGGSGNLNVTNLLDISLTVNWTKANDDLWPQNTLQYKVVRSTLNDISTLDQIETQGNGTVICDWTADIGTLSAQGLTKSTAYYFTVVVKDPEGNKAVYNTMPATTKNTIYMFATSVDYNGNLGGRAGADAKCASDYAAHYSHLGASHVRSLISVTDTDEIRDMPVNYGVPTDIPIRGPGGVLISIDWASLLDGAIDNSLLDSGVSTDKYWTGSTADGGIESNCFNWSTSDDPKYSPAKFGFANQKDSGWLTGSMVHLCSSPIRVIGICW